MIIDDHKMIRDGLRQMLYSMKKYYSFCISEAQSGPEALNKLSRLNPELIIIDYHMPGMTGSETIQRIKRFKPQIKILALSNYNELAYIENMMEAGAGGYILKSIEPFELLNAIKAISTDKPYYSNEIAIKLIEANEQKTAPKLSCVNVLTPRETEVLKMIATELTNDEIAGKLFVSKRTIDSHRQNLLMKLNVKNTVGLVKAAYKMKLIS